MRTFRHCDGARRRLDAGGRGRMVAVRMGDEKVRDGCAAHRIEQRRDVVLVIGPGVDDRHRVVSDDVAHGSLEGERARIVREHAAYAERDLVHATGHEIQSLVEGNVVGHALGLPRDAKDASHIATSVARQTPPMPRQRSRRKSAASDDRGCSRRTYCCWAGNDEDPLPDMFMFTLLFPYVPSPAPLAESQPVSFPAIVEQHTMTVALAPVEWTPRLPLFDMTELSINTCTGPTLPSAPMP